MQKDRNNTNSVLVKTFHAIDDYNKLTKSYSTKRSIFAAAL